MVNKNHGNIAVCQRRIHGLISNTLNDQTDTGHVPTPGMKEGGAGRGTKRRVILRTMSHNKLSRYRHIFLY